MKIPITAKRIKNTKDFWVDIDGSIYSYDTRNNHKKKIIKRAMNKVHGYLYCGINYVDRGIITKRVHRLVAETFISNPNNYNIVGHKNNIKSDNRVENLYWTTTSENTKKAFDDKLLVNAKGYDDSQSKPVIMFETKTNNLIKKFGSIKEATRQTGISSSTISRQAKYHRPVRKEYYFRYQDDKSV